MFNRKQQLIRIAALAVAELSLEELLMKAMAQHIADSSLISDEELAKTPTKRTAQAKYLADAYHAELVADLVAYLAATEPFDPECWFFRRATDEDTFVWDDDITPF